jgi:hypothetical protein
MLSEIDQTQSARVAAQKFMAVQVRKSANPVED